MRHPAVAVIGPDWLPQPGLGQAAFCRKAEGDADQETAAGSENDQHGGD